MTTTIIGIIIAAAVLVAATIGVSLLYFYVINRSQTKRREDAVDMPRELRTQGSWGTFFLYALGTLILIATAALLIPVAVDLGNNLA